MNENQNTELQLKGIEAAKMYLRRRGMEILNDEPFECEAGAIEIIAKDAKRGGLVFVEVSVSTFGEKFPAVEVDEKTREKLEGIAMAFLKSYDDADMKVSFDEVSIRVLSPDRALVRHNINKL